MRDYSGSKNPFFGKHHSQEQKDKWSEERKDKTYEEIYGIERAKEIKEKQSKRERKPCPPEVAKKIGDAQRGEKNHAYGKKPWNYGLKASPQAIENLSKSHIGQKSWNKDIPCPEKTKDKIRETLKGRHCSPKTEFKRGQLPSEKSSYGRIDYYDSPLQGIIRLRSSWEIKYAKYLDSKRILWMYEIETFPITIDDLNTTYTPDFFLLREEKFIEIKGNPRANMKKIESFREQYTWNLDVLFGDDLKNLGIDLKTKEPKFVFENKEEEQNHVKQM